MTLKGLFGEWPVRCETREHCRSRYRPHGGLDSDLTVNGFEERITTIFGLESLYFIEPVSPLKYNHCRTHLNDNSMSTVNCKCAIRYLSNAMNVL